MEKILVVCADEVRRSEIVTMIEERGRDTFKVASYANTWGMREMLTVDRQHVRVVVLSLVGEGDATWSMHVLRDRFPKARIIAELDADHPDRAFDLIRWQAFAVVTSSEDLWAMILKAAGGEQHPYPVLLKVSRPQQNWATVSMNYNSVKRDNNDHRLGIQPTMQRLRLGVDRIDEIVRQPGTPVLEAMIRRVITEREALVALISSYTFNTGYEIGVARALNKTIILLRHRTTPERLPSVLEGLLRVDYSSMTELSLRLFFGLGGTRADLHRSPKWWMTDSGNGELIK